MGRQRVLAQESLDALEASEGVEQPAEVRRGHVRRLQHLLHSRNQHSLSGLLTSGHVLDMCHMDHSQ